MDKKVIIIGSSNNFNELGLVRSFGVNNVKPVGIIICSKTSWRKDWLHLSKYWDKCYRVDNVHEALELLIQKFANETNKPLVTTPVDYVMQIIDDRYDELSEHFILQSICGKKGAINNLSNKLKQAELTEKLGFKTLPTTIINIADFKSVDAEKYEFPVLLKPVAGGEGSKDDITICQNKNELISAISKFSDKNYNRVLCQKYLHNRTEYTSYGALDKDKNFCSYTVLKNIRQWPPSYGVGSFAHIVTDKKILDFVDKLYHAVMEFGYDGPVDIEIFLDNDIKEIYVSEYNWRPGGRNYTSYATGIHSIYLWYLSKSGIDISSQPMVNSKDGFTMTEFTDFNYVLQRKMTFKEWKKDFKRSAGHSVFQKGDLRPAIIPTLSILKKYFKLNKQ